MPQSVYSIKMLSGASATGAHSIVVPVGYVYVLRDFDAVAHPTSGNNINLFVGGILIFIAQLGVEPAFSNQQWRGRQVAEPDDIIEVVTSDVTDFQLSGYRLTLP